MNIKLSLIVSIYNLEDYIGNCIKSIANQTVFFRDEIEVLLIDDGSTDNTSAEIDKAISDINEDIKNSFYYLKKKNGGVSSARNYGISIAKGEYIGFLDGDDTISKKYFEEIFKIIDKGDVDLLVYDYCRVISDSKEIMCSIKNCSNNITANQYLIGIPCPWNKIIKKHILLDNNLFFPEGIWYEDLALTPRFCQFAPHIYYLKQPLVNYIFRENSIMNNSNYNKKMEDIFKSIEILNREFVCGKYQKEIEYIIVSQLLFHSASRFLKYNKKEMVNKSIKIVKEKFPNWKQNGYFQNSKLIFLISRLVYSKMYFISYFLLRRFNIV